MALDQELETFARMKDDLVASHKGKFALIHGDSFLGSFDNAENAYKDGLARFGREPFLVKLIGEQEETYRNFALSSGLMHARI
jgi:hypothetical protein